MGTEIKKPILGCRGAKKRSGFTLIELTIVITIIGIFIGAIAQGLTIYVINHQQTQLASGMVDVQKGLRDFMGADDGTGTATSNGRYPCPASLTAPPSDPSFGLEQRDNAIGQCDATEYTGPGTVSPTGVFWVAGSGTPAQKVYIGTIPTRTMEISREAMLDPWQNRFTYAVSATLVSNGQPLLTTNPVGAITIEQDSGLVTDTAHFVIESHGLDGAGAYSAEGVATGNPCRTGEFGDAENCDMDAVFADLERVSVQGTEFYDDKITFTLKDDDEQGWWTASPTNPANIYNVNAGNVGIGTDNPELGVHVKGKTLMVESTGTNNAAHLYLRNNTTTWQLDSDDGPGSGEIGLRFDYAADKDNANAGDTKFILKPSGNVGIGIANPQSRLDVQGEVKIGKSSPELTCSSSTEGSMRYNNTTKVMEFCDGSTWKSASGGGGGVACKIVGSGHSIFYEGEQTGCETAGLLPPAPFGSPGWRWCRCCSRKWYIVGPGYSSPPCEFSGSYGP